MQLFWTRHAQAKSASLDKLRDLSDFGKRQAENLAKYIESLNSPPKKIYASTYNRAQQTAQIIAERLNLKINTLEGITPVDDPKFALAHLASFNEDALVVTHQPLWSRVYAELMCETTYLNIPTAGMAILEGELFVPNCLILKNLITDLHYE